MKKLFQQTTSIFLFFFAAALPTHAQDSFQIGLGDEVSSRVAINNDLGSFISNVFSAIILVAGMATFIYMIYGGVQWVTSGGEKDKVKEARDKITQAIIGMAVVASAWAIFKLVDYFFGIGIAN